VNLTDARRKRNWSFHQAAAHMRGVTEQQLRNLEGIGATRPTDPLNVRLGTALEILRVYHPDVSLDAFAGEKTLFRLHPTGRSRDRAALQQWGRNNFRELIKKGA
jgi:hypothetical protein